MGHKIGTRAIIAGREKSSRSGKEPCACSAHYCTLLQSLPPEPAEKLAVRMGVGQGWRSPPQVALGSDFLTLEA